ncbi:HET-domain-containing protein [Xylaria bambusicola]|uniref:HET-domain-containing protein n=1 Tax=Xylaria bambusicola TaxID=326684 RepID=UPI002007FAF9|nr:HET-domain-containing protein [Xylaria bambusicola]KAI0515468.1 HET-domain-containing protein [Xylaria bambusicola]
MWLINVKTRLLEEFIGLGIPEYAILSHTWEMDQEVTFQEFSREPRSNAKKGYWKIDQTCQQAIQDGLAYVWADTCCIDKSSSAELSEAINSMFRWYQRASVCYVYLSDLLRAIGPEDASLEYCRWFQRSWTLQELIAPRNIKFYSCNWDFCFNKPQASVWLSRIANINLEVLQHEKSLTTVCVAQKMSWARSRKATRVEDIAYSLLGIFDINMPLLYGEGDKAFMRLQYEIIRSTPDLSILAWSNDPKSGYEYAAPSECDRTLFSTVLASSPESFRGCHNYRDLQNHSTPDFSVSNRGIQIRAKFGLTLSNNSAQEVLPVCQFEIWTLAIKVRNVGAGCYVRQDPMELVSVVPWQMSHRFMSTPFLLTQPVWKDSWDTTFGWEPILSSRHCGLQVVLDSSMEISRRWPWTKWDEVDRLFFGPEDSDLGWAALKIVGEPPDDFVVQGDRQPLNFLLYVFGWAKPQSERPRYTLHRVNGEANDRALEEMNGTAVTEDWNTYWVVNRLVTHQVPEQSVVIVGSHNGQTLLLTCNHSMVEDQSICLNPFWRVTLSWQLVSCDQLPLITDGRWLDMGWEGGWGAPWRDRQSFSIRVTSQVKEEIQGGTRLVRVKTVIGI